MAARGNLAAFVARTLENARTAHAAQTWVDLVDRGAGDGGGLEADHGSDIMRSDDIAGAIADGVALHAKEHPEDAQRKAPHVACALGKSTPRLPDRPRAAGFGRL